MKTKSERVIYKSIMTGLNQAIDYEKGKFVKDLRRRKVTIAPIPHFSSNKIKEIRNRLNLSQATFAIIMGVSIKTIESLESGRNEPQGPAQRMLGLLDKDMNILEKYSIVLNK
jgi:putative transcriptional regulator